MPRPRGGRPQPFGQEQKREPGPDRGCLPGQEFLLDADHGLHMARPANPLKPGREPCRHPPRVIANEPMHSKSPAPLIGVSSCLKTIGERAFHGAADKYVSAVQKGAGGLPLLIPALGEACELPELVDRLDGLMLTGSPSNIEPHHYAGEPSRPGTAHDPDRDLTILPLVRHALEAGLPLLAICRGIQELNVALGGTLHQLVHELPETRDHRSDPSLAFDDRYGPAHIVHFSAGGSLEALTGRRQATVNSLHAQSIDRLAAGLATEAVADDGVIEAVRVPDAPAFALGVQWHPEWHCTEDPVSMVLFAAFGDAARARARARGGRARAPRVKVA